jgi:predicted phosphodiesterase
MRVAVISDIHGNLHALETVLAAIDGERPDAIWCLGDLVGYGPRPNECCELVAASANVCLVGNHDLGVTGAISLEEFSHDAATAARWTQNVLEPRWRTFLEQLEPTAQVEGAELYHASPRDPVWDYVLTADGAYDALNRTQAPLVLVGHSHVAIAVVLAGTRLDGGLAPDGTELALDSGRLLLNPGSVGQPRDGDPRAAYLMLDFDRMFATFRRVEYPVEQTQAELRERGLPETLAERLAHGQ